ncbi:MAG: Small, acid-soluble spore protein alpha/be [Clostridiales bacterium]|nr:Small, acid-soluble spore protein alpha/be [Clostridiales bacterium]
MSKRRSVMSEGFKEELAKEIGIYDTVQRDGWGAVSSRDCGNIVSAAIKYAEKVYEQQNNG